MPSPAPTMAMPCGSSVRPFSELRNEFLCALFNELPIELLGARFAEFLIGLFAALFAALLVQLADERRLRGRFARSG